MVRKCWKQNKRAQRNTMWTAAGKPGKVEASKATFPLWTVLYLLVCQRLTDEWKIHFTAICRPMTDQRCWTQAPKFFHQSFHILSPPPPFFRRSSYLMGAALPCCPLAPWIINTPLRAPRVAPRAPAPSLCQRAPASTAMTTRTICPSSLPLKEPVLRDKHAYSLAAAEPTRVRG